LRELTSSKYISRKGAKPQRKTAKLSHEPKKKTPITQQAIEVLRF
jgi:hypothetical protein